MTKKNETALVAKPEQSLPTTPSVNVDDFIKSAIDKNLPVESLERILAMRKEIQQEMARNAFNQAVSDFQSDCPIIEKTKKVRNKNGVQLYCYAPIDSIISQVKNTLQKFGLRYSTSMTLNDKGVKVTCRITHILGHSEDTEMEVPFVNKTDAMSEAQVVAATSTFAKRYAFLNSLGIMTGDDDNDGDRIEVSAEPQCVACLKKGVRSPATVKQEYQGKSYDLCEPCQKIWKEKIDNPTPQPQSSES